jgi:hypothetical protein
MLAAALLPAALLGGLVALPVHAATGTVGGSYHALQPARILDTRSGVGGVPVAPIQAGGLLAVQIAGAGGVPVSGASAVVMNVTATNTTAPGYLTVFPAGVTMPVASNLNWTAGQTVPNLVEVALGTGTQDGKVSIYNGAGSADVIFDVAGYYTTPALSPGPDGLFTPVVPARLLDTRSGNGAPVAKLGPAQTLNLQVTGRGGVPSAGVSSVVLNVTVTNPSAPGYLTVWPASAAMPLASNLNFAANQTVPNRVVVGVSSAGMVSIFNGVGSTDVVVDVNGWFTDASGAAGSRFVGITPTRILDSRTGNGGYADPWGPNSGRGLTVAGINGVPLMTDPNPPTAVVANVTVTNTTASSYLTTWPDGAAQPLASDLNWSGGTVPNLVVVQVGPTGKINILNGAGCTDVVVDVVGWFTGPVPVTTPGAPPTAIVCPPKDWLARLNYWRSTGGLAPLTDNPTWSQGDVLHSIWMVKNNTIMHGETPGTPYYTPEGDLAGQKSNIAVQSSTNFSDAQFVDFWMGAPFHAMGIMDPRLAQSGFGSYRDATSSLWQAGAALDVIRGNSFSQGMFPTPVLWPGNGMTVPLRTYSGSEIPDPLSACPGYSVPSGLPVFIELGGNIATTAGTSTFTANGVPLQHCVIDSTNANFGANLKSRGGVIVIPLQPLQPGVAYIVSVVVNGLPYTWSFQVS